MKKHEIIGIAIGAVISIVVSLAWAYAYALPRRAALLEAAQCQYENGCGETWSDCWKQSVENHRNVLTDLVGF